MLKDFSKEVFDIVIQGGQSNSQGYGFGDVSEPYVSDSRIWYFNSDFTISEAHEKVLGNLIIGDYSLSFARNYINEGLLKQERKLLTIRSSVGRTGFLDGRWIPEGDLYIRMMSMIETALSLNPMNELKAFLWHQGETDSVRNADFKSHSDNLLTLIRNVRTQFKCNDLPSAL